jgi:hypothetical protein
MTCVKSRIFDEHQRYIIYGPGEMSTLKVLTRQAASRNRLDLAMLKLIRMWS